MKQTLIAVLILISIFSCKDAKTKTDKLLGADTVITTGLCIVNINTSEYITATLQRIIKDSLQLTVTDSANGKITQEKKMVRDTSYNAWCSFAVPDSANKPMKSKIDPLRDSLVWRWYPIKKSIVILDYNKKW